MWIRRSRPGIASLLCLCACSPAPKKESAPPATTPPAASADARIAFAITFPRAGDTLIEGHTYTLRWRAPDTMTINLGAAMGGHDKGLLLDHAPSAPDSLLWTIPQGYVTGFGPSSSDVMRLRLENAKNPDQWTEVGPFTIRGDSR